MTKSSSRLVATTIICFFFSERLQAQDNLYAKYDIYRNPVRVLLNKFSITLTTGYSQTNYANELSNVYFFQNKQNQYIFNNDPEALLPDINAYEDWLNNPTAQLSTLIIDDEVSFYDLSEYLQNQANNPSIDEQFVLLNTDENPLGFEGAFSGIPINLQLHYNWRKFRVGIGFTYEVQFAKSLAPTRQDGNIRNYQPNFKSSRFTRFYGMLGYNFYSWWTYDFVAEVNYGKLTSGPSFNKSVISNTGNLNFGLSIENNWSEYVRLIVRPSIDFKSYKINVVDNITLDYRQPSWAIQIGLSINIPEIPRSPMNRDHTQLKHVLTDPKTGRRTEVRGQPIWKKQNPKIGENHRRLNQHLPSRKNKVKS